MVQFEYHAEPRQSPRVYRIKRTLQPARPRRKSKGAVEWFLRGRERATSGTLSYLKGDLRAVKHAVETVQRASSTD